MPSRLIRAIAARRRARAAAASLAAALACAPGLEAASVEDVLKVSAESTVALARMGDAPVIVKQFHGAVAAETVQRLDAELARVHPWMSAGRYRANHCLHARPGQGLAVLSHAPGVPLRQHIAAARGAARAGLLADAGRWLAAYAGPGLESVGFSARRWQARLQAVERGHLPPGEAALAERLADWGVARLELVRGLTITRAAGHGDFVGSNLIYDGQVLTGIDIQGTWRLPLARDMARFLVWLALHDGAPSGRRLWGMDAMDMAAFLPPGLISEEEEVRLLPVFLANQMLRRFCLDGFTGAKRARLRAAMEACLET